MLGIKKSTLLRVLAGLHAPTSGRVLVSGTVLPPAANEFFDRGVVLVPQSMNVFPSLTVAENLSISAAKDKGDASAQQERILALFPSLRSQLRIRASMLSGGERQMVALGSALMCFPRVMLLDEPTLGLGVGLANTLFEVLTNILRED